MTDDTPEVSLQAIEEMASELFRIEFGKVPNAHTSAVDAVGKCYAFVAAVRDLLAAQGEKIHLHVMETYDRDSGYSTGCRRIAQLAVDHGAPAATINFLAVLHLKG